MGRLGALGRMFAVPPHIRARGRVSDNGEMAPQSAQAPQSTVLTKAAASDFKGE